MIDALWDERSGEVRLTSAGGGELLWQKGWYGRDPRTRGQPAPEPPQDTHECTLLMPYEAFYLAFVEQPPVLAVRRCASEPRPMSASELWAALAALDPGFGPRMALYAHCRAAGWAPKSGVQHGVDFLLYRAGAQHTHALYATLLMLCESAPLPLSVAQIARNITNVAKELLVCTVKEPSTAMEEGVEERGQRSGTEEEEEEWIRWCRAPVEMVLLGRWDPEIDRAALPE